MQKQLNHNQRAAVCHENGPMLVLAGPGSGKTTVLLCRIRRLLEQGLARPNEILALTFSRAAADEMRERFRAAHGADGVSFGTFHSIFFRILRSRYGWGMERVLAEEERRSAVRGILEEMEWDIPDLDEYTAQFLTQLSLMKNELAELSAFRPNGIPPAEFKKLCRAYEGYKERQEKTDFDDMLTECYWLLEKDAEARKYWQRRFRYILVDEFQDVNRIQYEVIRMLALPENNLFAVGDDDQSIYRFRGAKPEIMLNFQKDYPSAGQVILNDNFRSTEPIVEAAGRVIVHNQMRFPKEIQARGGEGLPVRVLAFEDQQQECIYILRELQRYQKQGKAWSDTAVIYRTNTQPRLLLQKMMEFNLPFRVRDQMPNLFEHWIARNIFCYIRLAMGSGQRKDLLPILNRPKRYLNRECLDDATISWEHMLSYYQDKGYVCDRIEKLQYDLKMLGRMGPFAAISYIRHVIGYDDYLREYAQFRRMKEEELFDLLGELEDSARSWKTYEEWFAYMEKYKTEMEEMRRRQQEVKDGIQLTTMHSSKGLEYEHVFILDAAEGITPYKKAVLDADLEEERRMFYVAMTRAKKELTICYAKKQTGHELKPSRFLREMQGMKKEPCGSVKERKNPLEKEMERIRKRRR